MRLDDDCGFGPNSRVTVMLDFDEMEFDDVKYWAHRICDKFELQGFIVFRSSESSFHIVYDRFVSSWEENTKIMGWAGIVVNSEKLRKYTCMQLIKGFSTLRVSRKGDKPVPEIVYSWGTQIDGVHWFLRNREMLLSVLGDSCARAQVE